MLKKNPPARTQIHLGWIASWQWASIAKKIFHSYHIICSRVITSLAFEISSSSHCVFDKRGIDGHLQISKINQVSLSHNMNMLLEPTTRDRHTQI